MALKRRDFLGKAALAGTAVAGATLGATVAAPAVHAAPRTLKMLTTWPKNFPGLGTAAERFAQNIEKATDGAIRVRVFAAGELVPAFSAHDAVSRGVADMYHGAEYYWQGKSPAFNFFAAVPFGLTGNEMTSWIRFGGGQQLWDELNAQFNVKPLLVANTGVQLGGWFRKEINSLEDFKGLKMRMPGLGGEVLRRMGATAVALAGGEIFQALQSGSIDGTEWIGPWNDMAFGFYKVAKHYYYPGFHEPGSSLGLGINLDVWNSLTASQKAIFEAVAAAENDTAYAEFNARNATSLKALINDHGVQLKKFSDDILRQMAKASADVVREIAASDPLTQKVYDSFQNFRANAVPYGRISELAYMQARELDMPGTN